MIIVDDISEKVNGISPDRLEKAFDEYRKNAKTSETRVRARWNESVKISMRFPTDKEPKQPVIRFICSNCLEIQDKQTRYCSNCGARMEGVE